MVKWMNSCLLVCFRGERPLKINTLLKSTSWLSLSTQKSVMQNLLKGAKKLTWSAVFYSFTLLLLFKTVVFINLLVFFIRQRECSGVSEYKKKLNYGKLSVQFSKSASMPHKHTPGNECLVHHFLSTLFEMHCHYILPSLPLLYPGG